MLLPTPQKQVREIERKMGGEEREGHTQKSCNKPKIQHQQHHTQISLPSSPPPPPPPALTPPSELITRIFSQLDCIDLIHCSLVCKQWYLESTEFREGWRNEYLEACNLFGLRIKKETHPPSNTCSIRGLHSWCP